MKLPLLALLSFAFPFAACSQPSGGKLHVYSRITIPGIRPVQELDTMPMPVTYYIYAEIKKAAKIVVQGYWLNGKFFTTSTVSREKSPVLLTYNSAIRVQTDTLVKKIPGDLYRISEGVLAAREITNPQEKKAVTENQFVLLVTINGRSYLLRQKQIKELEPEAMM